MRGIEAPQHLSEQEQAALFHIMHTGTPSETEKARHTLIETNLGLVYEVLKKYPRTDLWEDLFQAGVLGLTEAVRTHDMAYDISKFPKYAFGKIIAAVHTELHSHTVNSPDQDGLLFHVQQTVENLETVTVNHVESHEDSVLEMDIQERLYELVQSLPPVERTIIEGRLGIAGDRPKRFTDLSRELGISKDEVSRTELRAFSRLRHPSRASHLT